MHSKCAVVTCRNRQNSRKMIGTEKRVRRRFHRFPRNIDQQNLWKKLCGKDSSYVVKRSTLICGEHFIEEECHTGQCKFFGTYKNSRCCCKIPEGTLPSRNLPQESMTLIEGHSARDKTHKKVDSRKLVQEIMEAASSPEPEGAPEPVTCVLVNETYPEEEDLQVFSESEPESEVDLVEDEPSVFQLEDLCRVCALAGGDMVGVFSTDGLLSKVSLCLPVKMEEGDQLPANVCRSCLNRIEQSFCLANMALKSEASLREMLQQQKTLFEDDLQPDKQDLPHDKQDVTSNKQDLPDEIQNLTDVQQNLTSEPPVIAYIVSVFDSSNEEVSDQLAQNVEQYELLVCPEPESIFTCHICEDSYGTRLELINHRNQEHQFTCCSLSEEDRIVVDNYYKNLNNSSNVSSLMDKKKQNIEKYKMKMAKEKSIKLIDVIKRQEQVCNICSEKWGSKILLKRHIREKHSEVILCSLKKCVEYFNSKEELKNHSYTTHKAHYLARLKSHVCEQCEKKFSSKSELVDHIHYEHEGNVGKYKCNLCDQIFKRRQSLKSHFLIRHTNERKFQCLQCDKMFAIKNSLDNHQFTHVQEKTVICEVCGASFKAKLNLNNHLKKVHTENWIYNCSICSTSYKSESEVLKHFNEHGVHEKSAGIITSPFSKTSEYQCQICLKYYANKYKFYTHKKTSHKTEGENCDRKWECEYCLKTFKNNKLLKSHLSSHMLIKPFQCSYCDKSYCTNHNLIEHTRIHTNENPFNCNLCEKSFRGKHKLQIHIRQVHEKIKNFQCSSCDKKFFSKVHLTTHTRSHTNERPYMCDICSQQFKHLAELKKHLKKHEQYEVLPRRRGPAKAKKSKKV